MLTVTSYDMSENNLITPGRQTRWPCRKIGLVAKWPSGKNTIWPPQAEKVFYKWPCRKNTHNLTTTGRQTRCSTGGLQSVHHRQTECSTSGLHSVHHRQTNKVFYKWLQSVHRKQTNKMFYKWPTIWPPQAKKVFYRWPTICTPQTDKQGVLQEAYTLTTPGRQDKVFWLTDWLWHVVLCWVQSTRAMVTSLPALVAPSSSQVGASRLQWPHLYTAE